MDAKYIYKIVNLSKEIAEKLTVKQQKLAKEFGFEPSLAEVIAYLLREEK